MYYQDSLISKKNCERSDTIAVFCKVVGQNKGNTSGQG